MCWAARSSKRSTTRRTSYTISAIDKTRDQKYLLLQSEAKDTSEVRYLRADRPADNFAVFLPREKGHRYYVDHREGLFYIRTNKSGRNFAVMTAPVNDPAPKNWKVFVAHRDNVRIQDIDLFRGLRGLGGEGRRAGPPAHLRFQDRQRGRKLRIRNRCIRFSPAARRITNRKPIATTTRAS